MRLDDQMVYKLYATVFISALLNMARDKKLKSAVFDKMKEEDHKVSRWFPQF